MNLPLEEKTSEKVKEKEKEEWPGLLCTATFSRCGERIKLAEKLPRLFNLRRVNPSSMRGHPRSAFASRLRARLLTSS